jgi:putative ABC transport system permease protein
VADDSFFKIFSFKFLYGTPATALNQVASVVLTSSTAKKYFGDENPIGKVLRIDKNNNVMVSGVIEDVPDYSQLKFDMMANYAMLDRSKTRKWDSSNDYSYLLLKPGTDIKSMQQKINVYVDNMFRDDKDVKKSWYGLEPLASVHLYSQADDNLEPSGNIKYIYILSSIAVILLLLACVNFLNLVTAKSIERSREIGVRKVMGALRRQLFTQFITEAAIITFIALIAGLILACLCFPWFSNFSGHSLGLQTWDSGLLVSVLCGLFIIVTLLAGTYPSLYLSAFNPVTSLKGKAAGSTNGNVLRKSLVVFQFVVSVFFIISTIIAGRQLQYIRSMDTGINRSEVMVLDIGGMPFTRIQPFRDALMQQQGIKNVTATYDSPVDVRGGYTINSAEGKTGDLQLMVTAVPVERNFVNTLGIKIIAGTDFTMGDEQRVLDTNSAKRVFSFIINESTAKALGWSPQQAIGKRLNLNGRIGPVRGVARDFNFASLHKEITPIVLFPEYDYFGKLLIKTSGTNTANTVAQLGKTWKEFYPTKPFDAHFLDEEYNDLYQAEQRTGDILDGFTLVTIFISCLGLFGLAIFSTKQRIREVGIRKVLGASVTGIVGLISWDFLKLVLISIVIASPLAYYAMHKWLQDFAFRITIQWWVFALAGVMALVIAFITIGFQSIKAAVANPVKSLRSE